MSIAKVQSRGQVTLPSEARRRAGIEAGDSLRVEVTGSGEIRLTRLPRMTVRELRERYRIETDVDWERDREAWQDRAARDAVER